MSTSAGIEPAILWSPVGRASNCATEAGYYMSYVTWRPNLPCHAWFIPIIIYRRPVKFMITALAALPVFTVKFTGLFYSITCIAFTIGIGTDTPVQTALLDATALRKHAYSNTLKIYHQKMALFHIKNSDIFHISTQNIDSSRRF